MNSFGIRSPKSLQKVRASQHVQESPALRAHALSVSPCEGLQGLIAERAYELYSKQGYRQGIALDSWLDAHWLDAEREVLSQIAPSCKAAA